MVSHHRLRPMILILQGGVLNYICIPICNCQDNTFWGMTKALVLIRHNPLLLAREPAGWPATYYYLDIPACTGNHLPDKQQIKAKDHIFHLFSAGFVLLVHAKQKPWTNIQLRIEELHVCSREWHAKMRNLPSDVDLQLFKKATRWAMGLFGVERARAQIVCVATLPLHCHCCAATVLIRKPSKHRPS